MPVLVDVEPPQGYFGTIQTGVVMSGFLGGLITGTNIGAVITLLLAWFLPPNGSLTVTGLDNRLALALFVPGTVVGSIVVEGNQWLKRSITTDD